MSLLDLQDKLLDRLETKEYASLQWGFVNGAFTEDELDDEARTVLEEGENSDGLTPDQLWNELVKKCLIFPLNGGGLERRYRTRFAETVRLLFYLRQLFPGRHWVESPTLVSDYRLLRKPRLYPRRHIELERVLAYIEGERRLTLSTTMRGAIHALVGSRKLSQFQLDATASILGARHQSSCQGTIVCAGTGTGKTLAFYLPCFTEIANLVRRDAFYALCMAIYPRNELLKDQFQTAFTNARLLDAVAARPVRLAAFYGSSPSIESVRRMARDQSDPKRGDWTKRPQGYLCPFLRCPVPTGTEPAAYCSGELLWLSSDLQKSPAIEQLYCTSCHKVTVPPGTIALSREQIEKMPPDVIFTTTEMLNRSLSNRRRYAMFGIGQPSRLRFVLLDEAHTYAGVSGAQNALLIRRWKQLLGYPIHFVGLSATLTNPRKFMAALIGEPEPSVEAISTDRDVVQHGWEYQLALRGDPASQTSLLSTSIQAVMLLGRMLDPLGNAKSQGIFASKVFAFTDDLDVTNRFFHNLKHAENFPRPTQKGQTVRQTLAQERRLGDGKDPFPDILSRELMGQRWEAVERLDRHLSDSLILDRVSSQDTGVNPKAEVVIATASLEVGFDDDKVGAVVQHKAPRGAASFLQRKGRAGRDPRTHPWTVVVLSDFGRDRVAYQGYEQLFDPELDKTDLPVRNRYVLKMQAVFALMDYIGRTVSSDIWATLAYPINETKWNGTPNGWYEDDRKRQQAIANLVRGIMLEEGRRERFRRYLQQALSLSEEEALSLFWQSPRALMTEVFPTILRRMDENFANESVAVGEEERRNPLPEFITSNLFSNLLVPEVLVIASAQAGGVSDHEEYMGILQALNQSSPGRVTRRFAVERNVPRDHWCPPPSLTILAPAEQRLSVSEYLSSHYLEGVTRVYGKDSLETLNIYRPTIIRMQRTEAAGDGSKERVDNTSRTALTWKSQFHPANGQTVATPSNIPLSRWIDRCHFFTHNASSPLRVQRFAVGCEGSVYLKAVVSQGVYGPREERPLRVRFTEPGDDAQAAAVGFELEVDAVGFFCAIPDDLLHAILHESVIDLRVPLFQHRLRSDPQLAEYSVFDRDWIAQIALSVYVAVARRQQLSLAAAIGKCHGEQAAAWSRRVDGALKSIFQLSRGPSAVDEDELNSSAQDDNEEDDDGEHGSHSRSTSRRDQLLRLLTEPQVRIQLSLVAQTLYQPPDAGWHSWLRQRLRATIGNALLQACYDVATDYQTAELYLDLEPGPPSTDSPFSSEEHASMLWISESIAGGAGVVEEVRRGILQDPDRFFQLVENAIRSSQWERLDRELRKVLVLLDPRAQGNPVRDAVATVRSATKAGIGPLNLARENLLAVLRQHEISLSHTVTNALNIRVLHPTSSPASDALLTSLLDEWDRTERELGVNIDARVFAYVAADTPLLKGHTAAYLSQTTGVLEADILPHQVASAVYRMLWPRGYAVRERSFEHYNPFATIPAGDPLLLERQMDGWAVQSQLIGLGNDTRSDLIGMLPNEGSVRLVVNEKDRAQLRALLIELVATPIETGFLIGYPRVGQVRLSGEEIIVWLTLPEAAQ